MYICVNNTYKHAYVHICSYITAFIYVLCGCHPSNCVWKTKKNPVGVCGCWVWHSTSKTDFQSSLKGAKKEKIRTEFIMAQQKEAQRLWQSVRVPWLWYPPASSGKPLGIPLNTFRKLVLFALSCNCSHLKYLASPSCWHVGTHSEMAKKVNKS